MPPLGGVPAPKCLRALRIDQPGARGEVGAIEHLRRRHRHRRRLGHVAVGVGEAELHRFDQQVLRGHAVDRQVAKVELLGDAERDQRRDALPVGRDLVQSVAAVVDADRLDPLRLEAREVGCAATRRPAPWPGARSPARSRRGRRPRRASTRSRATPSRHRACASARRPAGTRPRGRNTSAKPGCVTSSLTANASSPLVLDDHRHRVTALGDLDGRCQQVGERQLAEALAHAHPTTPPRPGPSPSPSRAAAAWPRRRGDRQSISASTTRAPAPTR